MFNRYKLLITLLITVLAGQVRSQPQQEYSLSVSAKISNQGTGKPGFREWKEYATRTVGAIQGFSSAGTVTLSKYGGRADRRVKATGFYYVKKIDGRWWSVDPDGYLFIHKGVNDTKPGQSEGNKAAFARNFSDMHTWATKTTALFRDLGFNGTGAWSGYNDLKKVSAKKRPLAYTVMLDFMGSYGREKGAYQQSGHLGYPDNAIFVFDPGFEKFCDSYARQIAANRHDPNLYGYFSDNEMPFYRKTLDNYLSKKDKADPGYQAAKRWLQNKHVKQEDITDQLRNEFLGLAVDKYFSIVSKAIRKYDPNHMYLGCRFNGYEKNVPEVMTAAGKYLDIISINHYDQWTPQAPDMKNWEKWSGKPFIITEWYVKGEDSGMGNYAGAGWVVKTQADRGLFYQNYALGLLESGSCVGWHWFKYQDNDPGYKNVDPSNTDANKGILDNEYKLYTLLTAKMKELNDLVYPLADFFDRRKKEIPQAAGAVLTLPALVSDGMVLQRDKKIRIWGRASPGGAVSIEFKGKSYQSITGSDGKWTAELEALPAGGPYTMTIKGEAKEIVLHDILIGDVWLCSGQSNMELPMSRLAGQYPEDLAGSANTNIRQFLVGHAWSFNHVLDVKGTWQAAGPATIGSFTAVGYYFAKSLYEKYKVPVGIIHSSWGGTPAESWISEESLREFPSYLAAAVKYKDQAKVKEVLSADKDRSRQWYAETGKADHGYLPGGSTWATNPGPASAWKPLTVPGFWEEQGTTIDGAVWVRKEFDLPANMTGKDALLELGAIDDSDTTFFNGVKVGTTDNKYPPRRYTVPADLLKPGRNVITVRIIDTDGNGGFIKDKKYRLISGESELSLAGEWQYRVGAVAGSPLPGDSFTRMFYQPVALYNAMIAPLIPYCIRGVAWYQGESNTGKAAEYPRLLTALINDWRTRWQEGAFPFLIVQLANYMQPKAEPSESNWAELREAQLKVASSVPNTGLAVTIDIGETNDVHPLNKRDVGKRLALAAAKISYGENNIIYSGPLYRSMEVKGNKVIISFDHTGSGLIAKGDRPLSQFAIAGADRKFVWANAKIEGDHVVVWSNNVNKPAAVRYAWANNPAGCNLYNKEGLPASPFRTDNWPKP